MEAFTFNTAELILLSAAGILFIIQLIYYFGLYNRIHVRNKTVRKEETHFSRELPPLSVILCARNEADNLRCRAEPRQRRKPRRQAGRRRPEGAAQPH